MLTPSPRSLHLNPRAGSGLSVCSLCACVASSGSPASCQSPKTHFRLICNCVSENGCLSVCVSPAIKFIFSNFQKKKKR